MPIRTHQLGGDVHRVELTNSAGAVFAGAMFRPADDPEDVIDQLVFLLDSARESLALSRPPQKAADR